jgi:hypothetical protein
LEVTVARVGPQPVVRLRLRLSEGRWSIANQIRIDEMTIPPSYQLPDARGRALTGAWCEVTDAAGAVIYRKLLPHLPGGPVEIPAEGGGLQRTDEYRGEDEFDVIVPDVAGLHTVNVYIADPRGGDVAATIERSRTPVASMRLRRGWKR